MQHARPSARGKSPRRVRGWAHRQLPLDEAIAAIAGIKGAAAIADVQNCRANAVRQAAAVE